MIPEGWIYVEFLWCPWCRRRLERTDNRKPWACACGFYTDGKHFEHAVMREA